MPAAFGVLSAMASSYGFDSHQVQIALRSAAPAKVLAAAALGLIRCWVVLRLLLGPSGASKRFAESFRTAQCAPRPDLCKRLNKLSAATREARFLAAGLFCQVPAPAGAKFAKGGGERGAGSDVGGLYCEDSAPRPAASIDVS